MAPGGWTELFSSASAVNKETRALRSSRIRESADEARARPEPLAEHAIRMPGGFPEELASTSCPSVARRGIEGVRGL